MLFKREEVPGDNEPDFLRAKMHGKQGPCMLDEGSEVCTTL